MNIKYMARKTALWLLSILAAGSVASSAAVAQTRLSAGAGKAAIDIPSGLLPLEGFGVEHDKLQARVLLLDNGSKRVALAVVDLTSIGEDLVAEMKATVSRATGVDPADILICASHTFSAPHTQAATNKGNGRPVTPDVQQKEARYHTAVMDALQRAATLSATDLRPAVMGYGLGNANVNVNRNMPTAEGWWLGASDSEPSDKSVAVLRFDDLNHHPIAVAMNYAVQSSIMDQSVVMAGGGKAITADLGGAAVQRVEDQYDGKAVSLFLVGAAGDQSPAYKAWYNVRDKDGKSRTVDIGAAAYPLIDLLGERLGTEVVRVNEGITDEKGPAPTLRVVSNVVALDNQDRPRSLQQIHATKDYKYNIAGKIDAPYYIMQIGDVALVSVQVELSAATGQYIKQHSPFKKTIILNMVNGAAKYLPDADGYKKMTYEAMNSSYGPGSAEILARNILSELSKMQKSSTK